MKQGNFSSGGLQRSQSFACFHADSIPNTVVAALMPSIYCEFVVFQNDPDSTGTIIIGSERLSVVGSGILLTAGEMSSAIAVENLSLLWHKESDTNTVLNYWVVGCKSAIPQDARFLLQELGGHVLLEDGFKIRI